MDTQIPILSPNNNIDEFEDLEVTQFDEDTLRKILFEEELQPNNDSSNIVQDCVIQSMVVDIASSFSKIEEEEEEELVIEDFDWIEMMELSDTIVSHEGVNEIFDVGELDFDFSHFCSSSISMEEIGYDVLWQNNL
ncbi:hypothetical protein EJD97_006804 [Solanum chilense]|uniref:Uncharacterized protein n=1 Tax=Solanum chilense TaxID=4083 RepID=A0A6N2AK27_SOLCI|nr:hypothetical protein EJD97_006804 [Solanum chilense]